MLKQIALKFNCLCIEYRTEHFHNYVHIDSVTVVALSINGIMSHAYLLPVTASQEVLHSSDCSHCSCMYMSLLIVVNFIHCLLRSFCDGSTGQVVCAVSNNFAFTKELCKSYNSIHRMHE